ncbi:MAG: ABC transporter substrate-binding protein [Spirosomataceae bacterium]
MKRFLTFICLFYASITYTNAQKQAVLTPSNQYKKAVQHYVNEEYQEALPLFTSLANRAKVDALVPYAMYYTALILFKQKKYLEARVVLRQQMERFPSWDKLDEIYYLYALTNHADNYHDIGFEYALKISEPSLQKAIENAQYHYLKSVTDLNLLKKWYAKYPQVTALNYQLIQAIQDKKYPTKQELELSDLLTNRLRKSVEEDASSATQKSQIKPRENGTIDMAVLLPFGLETFDPSQINRKNQYIYDLYLGMQMAQEDAKKKGLKVNLYPFDIGNSAEEMTNLVQSGVLEQMDALVGPLYPAANDVVAEYLTTHSILQIHPISNSQSLTEKSGNAFLVQPSYEAQAQKALEFTRELGVPRTVSIYHGNARKDILFAETYAKKAKELGWTVLEITPFLDEKSIHPNKGNPGSVFLIGDTNFAPKVARVLRKYKMNPVLFTTAGSFDYSSASKEFLQSNLYILYPEFISTQKQEVTSFKSRYINQVGLSPSFFSYLGYDLTSFFSKILQKTKQTTRQKLDSIGYTQGYHLSGFDYTKGNQVNQIVPVVKYQDGQFIEISR